MLSFTPFYVILFDDLSNSTISQRSFNLLRLMFLKTWYTVYGPIKAIHVIHVDLVLVIEKFTQGTLKRKQDQKSTRSA